MAKTFHCKDVVPNCDFVAQGETNEEVMEQVVEHASTMHGINEVPPEMADKVKAAIKDE